MCFNQKGDARLQRYARVRLVRLHGQGAPAVLHGEVLPDGLRRRYGYADTDTDTGGDIMQCEQARLRGRERSTAQGVNGTGGCAVNQRAFSCSQAQG